MDIPDLPTPEQLEQFRKILEQADGLVHSPDSSINALCGMHPDLVKRLEECDLASAVRLIAPLETIPGLLGNTFRIEMLLHLAISRCKGNRVASGADLENWLAYIRESPMARHEDPPEDVFIGYVCTRHGGFRVFPGIWSHADFILERLLRFLGEKTDFPGFRDAYESVLELLKVSEAVAESLGLVRYLPGDHSYEDFVAVPPAKKLDARATAVQFSPPRLDRFGIDSSKLAPFLYDQSYAELLDSQSMLGSPLELHPLMPVESGGFIVASPTSICRAATGFILKVAPTLGGWADTFFEKESAEFFVNRILTQIGIKPGCELDLPKVPPGLPPLYPCVGQFDYGMPALALTMSSPLTKGCNLEECESFNRDQTESFTQYLSECCVALEKIEGFKGGLLILAFSSVGRPIGFALGNLRPNWHFFSAALADWRTLASDEDFDAKRLWYLGLQQKQAEEAHVKVINTSGLLNLYGFWKQQDFKLLPDESDPRTPRNLIAIDGSYSKAVNAELKSVNDRHCRLYHDGDRWIKLRRLGRGLNPDLNTNLRYGDYNGARDGLIRGCVARENIAWWIEVPAKPEGPAAVDLVFRLWDCVLSWAERAVLKLEELHPEWIAPNLKVELVFPDVENWSVETVNEISDEGGGTRYRYHLRSGYNEIGFQGRFSE